MLGLVPTAKEGFTYFILAFAKHLDYGVIIGCLPFATYHNFNNGYFIDYFIFI